jgi:hypothetical protein
LIPSGAVFRYCLELAPEHTPRCITVEGWWLSCARADCWSTSSIGNGLDFFQLSLELAFVGFNIFSMRPRVPVLVAFAPWSTNHGEVGYEISPHVLHIFVELPGLCVERHTY